MNVDLATRQTYRNLLKNTMDAASIRNALGDIGNRIGLGNAAAAPSGPHKQALAEPPVKQVLKQTTKTFTVLETVTTTTEMTKSASNNSCIMLDESSDDDVPLELELSREEPNVQDIDACDVDNPQLCSVYVREIYNYLVHLERKYRVSASFLAAKSITGKMRAVLIDWLMQVHAKFRLLQETMYLCVHLIDAYLEREDVAKMQLQLVGVTALFLAAKYEEMYVPAIEDFVYMTDNTYTAAEIRAMEVSMLRTLNFALGKPLPLHFLRRFSKAGVADPKQHTLAKYLMELSLHEAEFASIDPSYLAASSLCFAFKLLDGPEWDKTMEFYSGYKLASLWSGMQKLARLVIKSNDPEYKYRAAISKYSSSKCMRISLLPELSDTFVRELASGHIPS